MNNTQRDIEEVFANQDGGVTFSYTIGKFTCSLVDLRDDTIIVTATSFTLAESLIAMGQALSKIKEKST